MGKCWSPPEGSGFKILILGAELIVVPCTFNGTPKEFETMHFSMPFELLLKLKTNLMLKMTTDQLRINSGCTEAIFGTLEIK